MSDPFVGEIRMFGGTFAPVGWAFCSGQLMPIYENDTLFTLIGTTYGGDGQETFGLPNLCGRVPIHMGTSSMGTTYQIGELAGVESVTLNQNQIPAHNHAALGSSREGNRTTPAGSTWATAAMEKPYIIGTTPEVTLNNQAIQLTGGNQPHENIQPYLCVSFIISLFGIFPTQT